MGARSAVAAVVFSVLVIAGCSDSDDAGVIAGSSTTGLSTTIQATTSTGLQGASTTPVSVAAGTTRALLRDVRSDHHPGYDRVVFEFENARPGYEVKYVPPPVIEDGSGKTIEVAGSSVLQVRMENAGGGDLSGENLRITYNGPLRISPGGTSVVRELARSGDFEGVLTWVVGTTGEVPFKVSVLSSPERLVIDLVAP